MFGNKLRAWMEAVRPKKKQHRKEKPGKCTTTILISNRSNSSGHTVKWQTNCLTNGKNGDQEPVVKYSKNKNDSADAQLSRYSANNLSSPESAYSTGYSTDGTSPGAPPDYILNGSKTTGAKVDQKPSDVKCQPPVLPPVVQESHSSIAKLEEKSLFYTKITDNAITGLVSPRQRNRIRTNPWLPGGSSSIVPAPLSLPQDVQRTPISYRSHKNSPIQHRFASPAALRRSLSSSSCSSISGANLSFDHYIPRSLSDEDDCTLNEMMGKYDESYVYEKETDILSDSDPTDCESDIDTGQDGGDEDDQAEGELDFIDNGSYLELDCKLGNTGHCLYFMPPDISRKRSSRRRNTRRIKESNVQRRRSSTNKRCHRHIEKIRHSSLHQDGSKSAGATPVSVRRSAPLKAVRDECLKQRSNSVCVRRDTSVLIDRQDREADMKYRELIGQAEQIIRTMNINGLSPRRLPGPANKRVELLRCAESAKSEVNYKNKIIDETIKAPSNVTLKSTRFSPKKNHITNFIINNSPVQLKKELQQSMLVPCRSPLIAEKTEDKDKLYRRHGFEEINGRVRKTTEQLREIVYNSPIAARKNTQPKCILHKNDNNSTGFSNTRHRRTNNDLLESSSSEEEFQTSRKKLSKSCPQSEPVRRKVYFGCNSVNVSKHLGKTVVFNLNNQTSMGTSVNNVGSIDNLRHQILLNTIQNLKKNLEDQSASLQQAYISTQNMYKY